MKILLFQVTTVSKTIIMKKVLLAIIAATLCSTTHAQYYWDRAESRARHKAEQKAIDKQDAAIDRGINETEKGIDHASNGHTAYASGTQSLKAYSNYDFVPGRRIVFEDHFTDGQDGEFPMHWHLGAGQGVQNRVGDNNALLLTAGNFAHVSPTIKGTGYLQDTFTIEFDSYTAGGYGPHLYFYANTQNAMSASNDLAQVNICKGNIWEGVQVSNHSESLKLDADYPAEIKATNYKNRWHHIAIAYQQGQLKVYVDQYRILAVPSLGITPKAFDIEGIGDANNPVVIANVKVANGSGLSAPANKIVTHGINFDVNKATIRPESMGTLKNIVQIMRDNPQIKFEVGGHTDNDGGDGINMPLSQNRADAVRGQLISMGIAADRLTAKGYGATKPIGDNSTTEGKANNRRVEFVKI